MRCGDLSCVKDAACLCKTRCETPICSSTAHIVRCGLSLAKLYASRSQNSRCASSDYPVIALNGAEQICLVPGLEDDSAKMNRFTDPPWRAAWPRQCSITSARTESCRRRRLLHRVLQRCAATGCILRRDRYG